MSAMQRLFELMAERRASDLFISAGAPIGLKVNGASAPISAQALSPETIQGLLGELLTEEQLAKFRRENELNIAYPVRNVGRFRISLFTQRSTPAMVVRFIPYEIPDFESLHLPPILKTLVMELRGLILMVGATGSGKSTSLAAMIDHRNATLPGHILTIEDPIEFLFRHRRSVVNQRELGMDSASYHLALKNALRQAPDVLLIGEIRDQEAMSTALTFAQSGHLVLATLHASNSYQALNRVVSFFPVDNRGALLQDLSSSLRAIVSQRLVRTADGQRVPAVEVLINTRHVSELIERGQINQVREAIETSLERGSQSFEQALFQMWLGGMVSRDAALAAADSANNLLWLMNNHNQGSPEAPLAQSRARPGAEPVGAPSADAVSFSQFPIDLQKASQF